MVVPIGYDVGNAYQVGASMDTTLFVRFLFAKIDRKLAEGLMTEASVDVVVRYATALERETPSVLWGQPKRIASGNEVVERCITLVMPTDRAVAYRALRGIRQDLDGDNLRLLRPVARAALARELRRLGHAVMLEWHYRFIDSDAAD